MLAPVIRLEITFMDVNNSPWQIIIIKTAAKRQDLLCVLADEAVDELTLELCRESILL